MFKKLAKINAKIEQNFITFAQRTVRFFTGRDINPFQNRELPARPPVALRLQPIGGQAAEVACDCSKSPEHPSPEPQSQKP